MNLHLRQGRGTCQCLTTDTDHHPLQTQSICTEYVSVDCINANFRLIIYLDLMEIYTLEAVRRKGVPDEEYKIWGDSICVEMLEF